MLPASGYGGDQGAAPAGAVAGAEEAARIAATVASWLISPPSLTFTTKLCLPLHGVDTGGGRLLCFCHRLRLPPAAVAQSLPPGCVAILQEFEADLREQRR